MLFKFFHFYPFPLSAFRYTLPHPQLCDCRALLLCYKSTTVPLIDFPVASPAPTKSILHTIVRVMCFSMYHYLTPILKTLHQLPCAKKKPVFITPCFYQSHILLHNLSPAFSAHLILLLSTAVFFHFLSFPVPQDLCANFSLRLKHFYVPHLHIYLPKHQLPSIYPSVSDKIPFPQRGFLKNIFQNFHKSHNFLPHYLSKYQTIFLLLRSTYIRICLLPQPVNFRKAYNRAWCMAGPDKYLMTEFRFKQRPLQLHWSLCSPQQALLICLTPFHILCLSS